MTRSKLTLYNIELCILLLSHLIGAHFEWNDVCSLRRGLHEGHAPTSADTMRSSPTARPQPHLRPVLQPPSSAISTVTTAQVSHTTVNAIPANRRVWVVERVTTSAEISLQMTAATTTRTTALIYMPANNVTLTGQLQNVDHYEQLGPALTVGKSLIIMRPSH